MAIVSFSFLLSKHKSRKNELKSSLLRGQMASSKVTCRLWTLAKLVLRTTDKLLRSSSFYRSSLRLRSDKHKIFGESEHQLSTWRMQMSSSRLYRAVCKLPSIAQAERSRKRCSDAFVGHPCKKKLQNTYFHWFLRCASALMYWIRRSTLLHWPELQEYKHSQHDFRKSDIFILIEQTTITPPAFSIGNQSYTLLHCQSPVARLFRQTTDPGDLHETVVSIGDPERIFGIFNIFLGIIPSDVTCCYWRFGGILWQSFRPSSAGRNKCMTISKFFIFGSTEKSKPATNHVRRAWCRSWWTRYRKTAECPNNPLQISDPKRTAEVIALKKLV